MIYYYYIITTQMKNLSNALANQSSRPLCLFGLLFVHLPSQTLDPFRFPTRHGQLHRATLDRGALGANRLKFPRFLSVAQPRSFLFSRPKRHFAQNASLPRHRARTGMCDLVML